MTASFSCCWPRQRKRSRCTTSSSTCPSYTKSIIDDPQFQINDTRILIPFTVGRDTHCFLGPVESLEMANKKLPFFSSAQGKDLLINQTLNISFFRLAPTKSADWRALGIQELLRLSHFSPSTLPWMIGAVTCFWNWTTNNFHLPCGMIGMSLLDVATITRLPINPSDCTSDMQPERQYNIVLSTSYSDFIAHNMGAEGTAVTDENIVQMSKFFLPLAALLHEENTLNLAKLLLGHLFKELGQFVHCLRDNGMTGRDGPLWLLQLWLNAIFKKFMTKPEGGATDKQHIEGFRLADYKPNFPNTQSHEDRF
ncbi:hypothetical protein Ahy_A02g007210 [Arachis hypogaea]|uniref:Aminotransferase-like plant mobile domain-containing protein n=1 Tax=Arachis hypogaea TaxID=3818 RepID=A0A445EBU7_ARAHY|nr:hypothetical protein Ahy_A02g007210 [Arachis hypogaea]